MVCFSDVPGTAKTNVSIGRRDRGDTDQRALWTHRVLFYSSNSHLMPRVSGGKGDESSKARR